MKYWDGEWPNLNSISVVLDSTQAALLSNADFAILYRLVWFIACQCVNSAYSDPEPDPGIPEDFTQIARLAHCSPNQLRRAWKRGVGACFTLQNGLYRLKNADCIRISPPTQKRKALSATTKELADKGFGRRCVYCGSTDGPFHHDHIFPISRGGSDDPSNIVLACQPCNLSKSDRTLEEWICSRAYAFAGGPR